MVSIATKTVEALALEKRLKMMVAKKGQHNATAEKTKETRFNCFFFLVGLEWSTDLGLGSLDELPRGARSSQLICGKWWKR